MKIIVIVLSGAVLTGGGAIAARKIIRLTSGQLNDLHQQQKGEVVPRDKMLQWYVEQTKGRGENEILLNAPFVDYPGNSMSTHFDDALAYFSGVVAAPIKSAVVAMNDARILTWYKFEIIDSFSERNPYTCSSWPEPPGDFLPIEENQFALATYGGTVTIEGVKVTMLDPTFPQLELGKKYFLFISKNAAGIAMIGVGPNGVFEVGENGSMTPINRNPHPIKDEVDKRFGKSVDKLRDHAKAVSK